MATVSDVYTIYANTGQLEEATRKVDAFKTKTEDTSKASAKAAMGFNALAQGAEDLQYSVGGAMNNLGQAAALFGAGGMLVAGITLVGVGINQLYLHWSQLTEALGTSHPAADGTIKRLEDIAAATKNAADATGEYTDRILANQAALTAEMGKNVWNRPLAEFGMEGIQQEAKRRKDEQQAAEKVKDITSEVSDEAGKDFAASIKKGLAEGETGQTLINAMTKATVEQGIAEGQIEGNDPRQFASAMNQAKAVVTEMMAKAQGGDTQAAADLQATAKQLTEGGFDKSGILGRFLGGQEEVSEDWEKRLETNERENERRTKKTQQRREQQAKKEADELQRLEDQEWEEIVGAAEKSGKQAAANLKKKRREQEKAEEELPGLQLAVPEAQNRLEASRMNLAERLFGGAPQRYAGTDWTRQVEGQGADFGRKQNELTQAHLEVARNSLTVLENIEKRDRAVAVLSR